VLDPSTRTGELAINASRGVLRLVGGKIIALAMLWCLPCPSPL
jgi:hypothetical protein